MQDIETARLILRCWTPADLAAYVQLHADPQMMYWLGGAQTRERAEASLRNMISFGAERGWGMRAVCLKDGTLVGAAGLQQTSPKLSFSGIEASWRLGSPWWSQGYATEAMRPLLSDGFARTDLEEVLAFTARSNTKSQAVMSRLGFQHDASRDFDHPALADAHPLRPHVFYRLPRAGWHLL